MYAFTHRAHLLSIAICGLGLSTACGGAEEIAPIEHSTQQISTTGPTEVIVPHSVALRCVYHNGNWSCPTTFGYVSVPQSGMYEVSVSCRDYFGNASSYIYPYMTFYFGSDEQIGPQQPCNPAGRAIIGQVWLEQVPGAIDFTFTPTVVGLPSPPPINPMTGGPAIDVFLWEIQLTRVCSAHDGDVQSCNAAPGCSYYACTNECHPTGTPTCDICTSYPGCSPQVDCSMYNNSLWSCNAAQGCSYYACTNECRPTGTPICDVCTGYPECASTRQMSR